MKVAACSTMPSTIGEVLERSVRAQSVPGRHNTCITTHVGELATTMSQLFVH